MEIFNVLVVFVSVFLVLGFIIGTFIAFVNWDWYWAADIDNDIVRYLLGADFLISGWVTFQIISAG